MKSLIEWWRRSPPAAPPPYAPIPSFHTPAPPLSAAGIAGRLARAGMSAEAVSRVLRGIADARQRIAWYAKEGNPYEAETVAHLVVPFLQALGWTPPLLGVGWHRMDVALFRAVPRNDANLAAIVEVKRLGFPLVTAVRQARRYVPDEGPCDSVVVTDGMVYDIYTGGKDYTTQVVAHMDLMNLRDAYGIEGCGGAVEALLALRPGVILE